MNPLSPSFLEVPQGLAAEICRRIPPGSRSLLDVGGGVAAILRKDRPGLATRQVGEPGDIPAEDMLPALAALRAAGERFEVLVLAEVLSRVADPFELVEAAAAVALPGARMIVTAFNVACFPLVEALIRGRFVPVVGPDGRPQPLRWFTRISLREILEETGFREILIEPLRAPVDSSALAGALRSAGVSFLADEMTASRWIATGSSNP